MQDRSKYMKSIVLRCSRQQWLSSAGRGWLLPEVPKWKKLDFINYRERWPSSTGFGSRFDRSRPRALGSSQRRLEDASRSLMSRR